MVSTYPRVRSSGAMQCTCVSVAVVLIEVKNIASVTAVSIERHAGDRLRRADLRGVYDLRILASATEIEQ